MNVIEAVQAFNAGRDPERLGLKYERMRGGPFAFLRGTCHLFAGHLAEYKVSENAPLAWVCGDLHLENFGTFKGDNRLVYFDINDFDEATLAPASWDLLRLLTSVRVAAREIHISDREAERLCVRMVDAYDAALAHGKAMWVERDTAQGLVRALLDALRSRGRRQFLDARTVLRGKRRRLIVDGTRALPTTAKQRQRVERVVANFAAHQEESSFFEVMDSARRVAGTGSLGVDRFVVLVRGKGPPDGNYLLDLKQALPSSLTSFWRANCPRWRCEADRVVTLQRRIQAVPMAFLDPIRDGKRSYVLRALQPSEDRVTLDGSRQTPGELTGALELMASCTAWGHLRGAGRDNSASPQELVDYGLSRRRRGALVRAADELARKVRRDWRNFAEAYDDGLLRS